MSAHFKRINNIYPTDKKLHHWKIQANDFHECGQSSTLIHVLTECEISRNFVFTVQSIINAENVLP